jgi:hypothetical protein
VGAPAVAVATQVVTVEVVVAGFGTILGAVVIVQAQSHHKVITEELGLLLM